jgi:hypothetical protein
MRHYAMQTQRHGSIHAQGSHLRFAIQLRRFMAATAASLIFVVGLYVAVQRARFDRTAVWVWAPATVFPEGHLQQVKVFRNKVPPGSTVFYLEDKPEGWQFGLWQRSLYPDYVVIRVFEANQIHNSAYEALRRGKSIRYALSAGSPPPDPGFISKFTLPAYPGGIPIAAGELQP